MNGYKEVLSNFNKFRETYVYAPNLETIRFSKRRSDNDDGEFEESWEVLNANSFCTYTCITDHQYNFLQVDANLHDYDRGSVPAELHHWSDLDYTKKDTNKYSMARVCKEVFEGHTHVLRRTLQKPNLNPLGPKLEKNQKLLITISVMQRGKTLEESTFVTTVLMEEAWRSLLCLSHHRDTETKDFSDPLWTNKETIEQHEQIRQKLTSLFERNSNFI